MSSDIRKLSGRELDAAVAQEVMGWHKFGSAWFREVLGLNAVRVEYLFSPTVHLVHLKEVEDEIEKRGLGKAYISALETEMRDELVKCENLPETIFRIKRATPEQCCRAALAAVRGKNGGK